LPTTKTGVEQFNCMSQPLGNFFVDREQAALSSEEEEIVRDFHRLYYRLWFEHRVDTHTLSWFGYEMMKCPLDLWIYQELLVRTRPDFVVETGTWQGGSALYLAMLLDHLGHGQVVTVEVDVKPNLPEHPRIKYIVGSCLDPAVLAQVREAVGSQRALVILDSHHETEHVYQELRAYSPLVQTGDYLIVEDTNINGHPVYPEYGPGPTEAIERFLSENDEFAIDPRCERFLLTMNPKGYLRRVRP
jgi:cephalosporin hydroxylase